MKTYNGLRVIPACPLKRGRSQRFRPTVFYRQLNNLMAKHVLSAMAYRDACDKLLGRLWSRDRLAGDGRAVIKAHRVAHNRHILAATTTEVYVSHADRISKENITRPKSAGVVMITM